MSYRDWDKVCLKDINHPVMRSDKYDRYACLVCDEWVEKGYCMDPDCFYCRECPEKPSEK